ncbi:MAG TPA: hypothetical protein VHJ38_04090 [Nitrososphaeraceae archaeon]|nr:hypothetical protein [Nitrososphaeraceae archaeon]
MNIKSSIPFLSSPYNSVIVGAVKSREDTCTNTEVIIPIILIITIDNDDSSRIYFINFIVYKPMKTPNIYN